MSADVTPLRADWPVLEVNAETDEGRRWWLPYNTGYSDGVQSILNRLGLTLADLDEVADALELAGNEPHIRAARAARGMHLSIAPS